MGMKKHSMGDGGLSPRGAGEPGLTTLMYSRERVYPRVGGGTFNVDVNDKIDAGLSPRGRGNPYRFHPVLRWPWSIPAWAGEPLTEPQARCPLPVYPRVGGGTISHSGFGRLPVGLSPRGRGNLDEHPHVRRNIGSIPAWAGEPFCGTVVVLHSAVYPRVGGGTTPAKPIPSSCQGLSPRGRGNRRYSYRHGL